MRRLRACFVGAFTLVFLSCGGGPEVGEGDPLSSLSPEPTALELYAAFYLAIFDSSGLFLFRESPRTQSLSQSDESPCQGGGKISQITTAKLNGTNSGTFNIQSNFENCEVIVSLTSGLYVETLNGSSTLTSELKSGGQVSGHRNVSLSISGDLGLALECNQSAFGTYNANLDESTISSASGQCTFRDSEGAEISISADDTSGDIL